MFKHLEMFTSEVFVLLCSLSFKCLYIVRCFQYFFGYKNMDIAVRKA